jgi:hypothetical protein
MCYNSCVMSARSFRALRTMRPHHVVPLTPSESALPSCMLSCKQIVSVSPLESTLTSHPQLTENTTTLSLAESALTSIPSASPLESAVTKTPAVGGIPPVLERAHPERSRGATCHYTQVLYFHILTHSFALIKNSSLLFSSDSALFGKNNRGWGYPLIATRNQNEITERSLPFAVV